MAAREYALLSAAAKAAGGTSQNGWIYWRVKNQAARSRAFPKSICSNPMVIGSKHSSSCIGLADHISGRLSLAVSVTLERPWARSRG